VKGTWVCLNRVCAPYTHRTLACPSHMRHTREMPRERYALSAPSSWLCIAVHAGTEWIGNKAITYDAPLVTCHLTPNPILHLSLAQLPLSTVLNLPFLTYFSDFQDTKPEKRPVRDSFLQFQLLQRQRSGRQ
jgi:hypothetical protein